MPSLTAISLFLRALVFLLVAASTALILIAPGSCFWVTKGSWHGYYCPPQGIVKKSMPLNVGHWSSNVNYIQKGGHGIWGQIPIMIISLIFSVPSFMFTCLKYKTGSALNGPQIIFAFIAFIVYLTLGGVETWYATGFSHMASIMKKELVEQSGSGFDVRYVIWGWVAAAILLFLCALLELIDGVLVCFRRGKYHVMYKYYR
ncbi:hypothetical protein QR680_004274 [Steinernema hermaphroditum]|uniref:Uncharacterized protein n=1 Tax=Steinernema hermaphroditum TaxID=289476 RepID=A0AA39HN68_9BILA|nr:hypothetical protein QR680_004274 [Steinernema hermaphroditum]